MEYLSAVGLAIVDHPVKPLQARTVKQLPGTVYTTYASKLMVELIL